MTTTLYPDSTTANNHNGTTKQDDCFLCRWFPFLSSLFHNNNHNNVVDDTTTRGSHPELVKAEQEVEEQVAGDNNNTRIMTMMDLMQADYRGFLFCVHAEHGYLLLHCTRKKKKPSHFQLPGGHIDAHEFQEAAKCHSASSSLDQQQPQQQSQALLMEQLILAGQMGAARELYEETGLDVRHALHRLHPTRLRDQRSSKNKNTNTTTLINEYKNRLFYTLHLTDDDFLKEETMTPTEAAFLQKAMGAQPPNLKVKRRHVSCQGWFVSLSHEIALANHCFVAFFLVHTVEVIP